MVIPATETGSMAKSAVIRSKVDVGSGISDEKAHPTVSGTVTPRAHKRSGQSGGDQAIEATTGNASTDSLADALTAGFKKAVEAAIAKAHAAGLAVPGREGDRAVEYRPDGQIREIDEDTEWSPHHWRSRP